MSRKPKKPSKIDLTVLSTKEQEDAVLDYAHRRALNAATSGGHDDPYVSESDLQRRFSGKAWGLALELVRDGRLGYVLDQRAGRRDTPLVYSLRGVA